MSRLGRARPIPAHITPLVIVVPSGSNQLSGGPTLQNVTVTGTLIETFVLSGGPTLANIIVTGLFYDTFVSGGPTLNSVIVTGTLVGPAPPASGAAPDSGSAHVVGVAAPSGQTVGPNRALVGKARQS